jgi:hypothetical protein
MKNSKCYVSLKKDKKNNRKCKRAKIDVIAGE